MKHQEKSAGGSGSGEALGHSRLGGDTVREDGETAERGKRLLLRRGTRGTPCLLPSRTGEVLEVLMGLSRVSAPRGRNFQTASKMSIATEGPTNQGPFRATEYNRAIAKSEG